MKIACCGEHTTRSAHPEFQPEYPERVLERVSKMGHTVKNFGFPTAVVCSKNAPDVKGGKAKQYLNTDEAKACAAWQPDLVILGPFGKHDALGQYPPPKGGARYDEPPTFSEEEFYAELKGMAEWARGLGAQVAVATPIPFPFGSTEHTCATVVLPATARVAKDLNLTTINLYSAFKGRKAAFTDADHLQDKEIDLMADLTVQALTRLAKL